MIQIIQVNIITGKRAQAALLQKAHSSEGGAHHSSGGRTLDGRIWDEMPEPSGQLRLEGF